MVREAREAHTLFKTLSKPVLVQCDSALGIHQRLAGPAICLELALKGVFHADFAAILLSYNGTDNGTLLTSHCMTSDVVGNGQEDQRM